MGAYLAIYEDDGRSPRGRLVAATTEPLLIAWVAMSILGSLEGNPANRVVDELDDGRRRALSRVVDEATQLLDTEPTTPGGHR